MNRPATRPAALAAAVLAAAAVVLAGCGSGGGSALGGSSGPSSEPPTSTVATSSSAPVTDVTSDGPSTPSTPQSSPDLDPEVAGFVDEFHSVQGTLEEYWATKLPGYEKPSQTLAFSGENDDPSTFPTCGGQQVSAENGFYCPPDNTVILDADWMYKQYNDIGDTFLYVLLAHEYGHSAQANLSAANKPADGDEEIQADCFSGSFLQEEIDAGTITEEDGDEQEINNTLASAAGDFGTTDSHGTLASRASAFEYGRSKGADGCLQVDAYRR